MPIIANCVNEAWLDHFTEKGSANAEKQPTTCEESPPEAPNDGDYRVPSPRSPEGEKSAALRRIRS